MRFGSNHQPKALFIRDAHHAVTHANVRLDVARVNRVGLDLLAEGSHKDAKRGEVRLAVVAPDLVQDEAVREDLVDVVRQKAKELVLDGRQVQFPVAEACDACRVVDSQVAVLECRRFLPLRG